MSTILELAALDQTARTAPQRVVGPTRPAADGQTLAELNLRARTGATVVAIGRGGDTAVLPTGHERLTHRDTLAVSGSAEAVERARALLVEPRALAAAPGSDGPMAGPPPSGP